MNEQTNILGRRVVEHAENVEDMGDRVKRVLTGDPRDLHYAGNKLGVAIQDAAMALALVGWELENLQAVVQEAFEEGLRYKRELIRDLAEVDS